MRRDELRIEGRLDLQFGLSKVEERGEVSHVRQFGPWLSQLVEERVGARLKENEDEVIRAP